MCVWNGERRLRNRVIGRLILKELGTLMDVKWEGEEEEE